ncbi:MAG: cytidylate kinase [Roseibacillus sp.]|jgi:cytidylate kinase|nr:cytidylate kinase [Roseibacillus sp.]MCP4729597.1 (d)CMP kinase [Roseibacillus sp.]MDP7495389.1 (d)CMP kinase [Roseibacillus sp.]HJM62283.1 (d)CMP kinase [Roseibacillus sp.]|tara:strand:- start:14000 stop:14683 length:684 start_codon:yes stop_codon:yes gene_type:complete
MSSPNLLYDAIAIDGPAASGKSTVARLLAERLNLIMVNSGEMYRAVTLAVMQHGVNPCDPITVADLVKTINLCCIVENGGSQILLDGEYPGSALRSDNVNAAVSAVAAVPEVRHLLVALQRGLLQHGDLVMEGRDIGSIVFPNTPYKIYIEASEEIRRQRRAAEGQTDSVGERDRQDSARKTSPLVVPDGAEVIDSSQMGIEEVVKTALGVLETRGWFDRESERNLV